jgi:hypothetical protein
VHIKRGGVEDERDRDRIVLEARNTLILGQILNPQTALGRREQGRRKALACPVHRLKDSMSWLRAGALEEASWRKSGQHILLVRERGCRIQDILNNVL